MGLFEKVFQQNKSMGGDGGGGYVARDTTSWEEMNEVNIRGVHRNPDQWRKHDQNNFDSREQN